MLLTGPHSRTFDLLQSLVYLRHPCHLYFPEWDLPGTIITSLCVGSRSSTGFTGTVTSQRAEGNIEVGRIPCRPSKFFHQKVSRPRVWPKHRDGMLSDEVPIGCVAHLFHNVSPDAVGWSWKTPDCDELLHAADPHGRRKLALGDSSGSAFRW